MTVPESSMKSQSVFRPLATACLRAPFDPFAVAQAEAAFSATNFDWPAFVSFLHHERISPLIYYYWKDRSVFPPSVERSLKQAYLQNAWINDLRMEELENILAGLKAAGIESVVLKGSALVHTIYEKSALRPMCDIDLLVRPADTEKTLRILAECGYTTFVRSHMPEEFENEVGVYKPGQHAWKVDLHCSLLGAPHSLTHEQMQWFWQNRVLASKNGRELGVLDVDAQLLHLCAHLWLHHGGSDLLGVNDIYQWIVRYLDQINWEKVLEKGKEFELLLPLQKVLPEMATQWNIRVPEEVMIRLNQMVPSLRERRKFNRFIGDGHDYISGLSGRIMSYRDWKTRFRFAWAVAFPPVHYMEDKFQIKRMWTIPYYYAYRIFSRVVKQTTRMIQKAVPGKFSPHERF